MTPEFVFTEEHRALRATVGAWCEDTWSEAEVHRQMQRTSHTYDCRAWRSFGRDLGLIAMTVPAQLGGAGAGWVELAIVAEEFGRVLACAPLLGTTMAATALASAADESVAADVLGPIFAGERIPALMVTDEAGAWLASAPSIRATRDAGVWRLRGKANHVLDGVSADQLVVLAATPSGERLFLADGAGDGVVRHAIPVMDQTRQQATVVLEGAVARPIGPPATARAAVERAGHVGALVLAAEQLGGSEVMLDRAVAYAKAHLQFGRPIGSFQAVRHRCTDMAVHVEHARSAVLHAAWAADAALDDVALATSFAHVVASEAHKEVAGGALQVHGGVGFTWEHPVHLYLKRAWSDAALLGGRAIHRAKLRPLLGAAA